MKTNYIECCDCMAGLGKMHDNIVDVCVTSPPYYRLRDYGTTGQIGLEATPEEYVKKMVDVFREVKRVLRDDGTLWLNIGDSYCAPKTGSQGKSSTLGGGKRTQEAACARPGIKPSGDIKTKELIGIPWMLAFAMRADGWYLRQDIIWHKPNAMPESVRDRCVKSHEHILLFSKQHKYYFDYEAIREQTKSGTRTRRDVWTIATKGNNENHFATFPEKLVEPCILAGSRKGGMVLDPFSGTGTTAAVAAKLGRKYIGIDNNPDYCAIAKEKLAILQMEEV